MKIQEQTEASDRAALDHIRTFLAVMATALRETVVRFEETTACVTGLVVKRAGGADRDLVVTLQNFDRLQQEFSILTDVCGLAAGKSRESWSAIDDAHPVEDAIEKIPMADLKGRMLRRLVDARLELTASPMSEEAVF